jgi:hypothetical protein
MLGTSNTTLAQLKGYQYTEKNMLNDSRKDLGTICEAGGKHCVPLDRTLTSVKLFLADQDMARRFARAMMHAALLCGGTKAVSPF